MCTALTLQAATKEMIFGRTMDFSFEIMPNMYQVLRGYTWKSDANTQLKNPLSFMGIGQQIGDLLAFFDGVNESGFAAASLYFAGYAVYDKPNAQGPNTINISSFDFLHYMLANCTKIDDLRTVLSSVNVVAQKDPVTNSVAPLHWIACDKSGKCVVIEMTKNGVFVTENSLGVMANSPHFDWHLTNLRNYSQASQSQNEKGKWGELELLPFGQGAGTFALPGGYTSPERFVRTAFLKANLPTPPSRTSALTSCFNIMKTVSIPKGAVLTSKGSFDYTKYTAFIDLQTGDYYFSTYDNPQIIEAHFCNNESKGRLITDLGSIQRPISFNHLNTCN